MNPLFAQASPYYPPAYPPRTASYPYYADPANPLTPGAGGFDWTNPFVWILIAVAVLAVFVAFAVMKKKSAIESMVNKYGGTGAAAGLGGAFVYLFSKMKGSSILSNLAKGQVGPLGMLALTAFGGPSILAKVQDVAKKLLDSTTPTPPAIPAPTPASAPSQPTPSA